MANNTILIHISTDFVFNGDQTRFYTEDATVPLSVYGATKLSGERAIEDILKQYFTIRTSWLYSEQAKNFVKTMIKLVTLSVHSIKTEVYPLPTSRPKFSVMDKSKIKFIFKIEIPYWREGLKKCLSRI